MQSEKAFIHFWDDYAIPEKSSHQLRDIAEHAFMSGRQSTAAPELLAALQSLLTMEVKGHQLQDRLQFTPAGRAILEPAREAIAKATGHQ